MTFFLLLQGSEKANCLDLISSFSFGTLMHQLTLKSISFTSLFCRIMMLSSCGILWEMRRKNLRGKKTEPNIRKDCPIILNTSLNIRGEPVVNDRADADRFQQRYNVKVCS